MLRVPYLEHEFQSQKQYYTTLSRLEIEGADEASSKILNLFKKNEFSQGKTLAKITSFKSNIFMPSPDYIIALFINKDIIEPVKTLLNEQLINPDSLALYKFLKGKLCISEVKGAISLKTSNRPDRRYQPLFEAAIIKAMGYILEQNWQYYMVASDLSSADRTIFNTAVAPHGIALQNNFKLVDGTYPYNRKEDLLPLVEAAIQA